MGRGTEGSAGEVIFVLKARQRACFSGDRVIQWGGDFGDLGDAGLRELLGSP